MYTGASFASRIDCNTSRPIGPAPITTVRSPSRIRLARTACNPTMLGSLNAAVSSDIDSGTFSSTEACVINSSAYPPGASA